VILLEWSEFARRLGRELAGLDTDTILIVREREESRHYVQAMREPDRLYAEAVSNNFLDGPLLLTPADEEVMSEAGWQPPADPLPRNWWTELAAAATGTDHLRLADMMVTALRDVQGVRRPADLVYESFHRLGSGLIELLAFGIPTADPGRVTQQRTTSDIAPEPVLASPLPAPMPAPVADPALVGVRPDPYQGGRRDANGTTSYAPAPHDPPARPDPVLAAPVAPGPRTAEPAGPGRQTAPDPDGELEELLADAKQRGDHVTYFDLLLRSDLVLPLDEREYPTTSISGTTYLMAFSSVRALAQALGARAAGQHRRAGFAELAGAWPDPGWALAINAGLPSEVHLDAAAVARLHATRWPAAERPTAPPGQPMRLPHGARIWRAGEEGRTAAPIAVYDGASGGWTRILADTREGADTGLR
jgi:type III secretion system-like peptide-binding chaperone/type III secretion system (T3SS) SseB-like protein